MSTFSTNLKLELIGTGDQSGTWGSTTNTNLGTLLEQAISGYTTQAITDGADTTITIPDGATGVARNMVIEMTGALTAARNLIVPANKKLYFIYNNTTGGFAVTVKVTGLTGVSVPNGARMILLSNGTDVVNAVNNLPALLSLAVSGDGTFSGTGQVKLPAGTTGQRSGTPATGMIRYNSTTNTFEGYGSAWGSIGGGATGAGGDTVFQENQLIVTTNYTLSTGKSAMSVGPITINGGASVVIPGGYRWLVL